MTGLRNRTQAIVLIAFSLLTLTPSTSWSKAFNAEEFYLNNGMQVIVIPNHRAPVVSHMVWYKVGAADEPANKSGIAHFFEHLMFKGTKKFPSGHFSKTIQKNGGNDNAFTSQDYTAYYQNISKDKLELVMEMESDRMRNLNLTPEILDTERQVILEERRQRTDNNPQARFREKLMRELYPEHPYGIPVIGWPDEIKSLSYEDASTFYKKWYSPAQSILVISGDITSLKLKPLAEKYYGRLPKLQTLPRNRPAVKKPASSQRLIEEDAQIGAPLLQILYQAPSANEALEILSSILGGNSSSRLYRELVVNKKIAVNAGSGYSPVNLDKSSFVIYATPTAETDIKTLEKEIYKIVSNILEETITIEEIQTAKERLQAGNIYERDSLSGPPMIIGRALASGLSLDYVENWSDRIQDVKADEIRSIAQQVLGDSNPTITGILLPINKDGGDKS